MAATIVINKSEVEKLNRTYGFAVVMKIAEDTKNIAKTLVAVDTGALRDSIEVQSDRASASATVGSDLPYAMKEELRKPYLRPALNQASKIRGNK